MAGTSTRLGAGRCDSSSRSFVSRATVSPGSSLSRKGVPSPDNYVLTDLLGSGTYATVYKGYNKSTHEVVAVKCIDRRMLSSTSVENLLTEIEVMKKLDHRNIVRLLDFEWDNTHVYLIMEYCSGGDLSSFIRSHQQLNEVNARKFLRQLALALQYLRSQGVAHLDLKPQNLLLTLSNKPILKIGDFGMAQHMNAGDHAQSFRGSPLYMAPEIMLGQEYDAKVDLWSVGVILYETLFGAAPFASERFDELVLKVTDDRPVQLPSTPEISIHCQTLLIDLLQRDPKIRITFEDFFNHPFVDLEHMPSADSLLKARELVKQAVVKDSDGKLSSALNYYCQSLDYFIPAIDYEQDPANKEALRNMVGQYIDRAEEIKALLRRKRPSVEHSGVHRLLDQLQEDYPVLQEALKIGQKAEALEDKHKYKEALELYKEVVEKILPVIGSLSTIEQKKLVSSQVEIYLQRAEYLTVINERRVPRLKPCNSPSASLISTASEKCKVQ